MTLARNRKGGDFAKWRAAKMSETDAWIDRLIAAGCMPKVAAAIVTEVFVAGARSVIVDKAAEKRREWDRERHRKKRVAKARAHPPDSGGNTVEPGVLHRLWHEGIGHLRQLGVGEKVARSNVGLWLKTQKPEAVLERIHQAYRAQIVDPVPWITRSFGAKNGKHDSPVASAFDSLIARAEGATGPEPVDHADAGFEGGKAARG